MPLKSSYYFFDTFAVKRGNALYTSLSTLWSNDSELSVCLRRLPRSDKERQMIIVEIESLSTQLEAASKAKVSTHLLQIPVLISETIGVGK